MRRLSSSLSAGHSSSSISIGLSSTDMSTSSTLPSTPTAGGGGGGREGDEEEPPTSALPTISLEFSDTIAKLHQLMAFFRIGGVSDKPLPYTVATPIQRTPWGQRKVSFIERCPFYRGQFTQEMLF